MIVLGVVNGVVGSRARLIVFAVVAGVVFMGYVVVHIWTSAGGARQPELHGGQDGGGLSGKPLRSLAGNEEQKRKAEV
jgi:hypothetical protein